MSAVEVMVLEASDEIRRALRRRHRGAPLWIVEAPMAELLGSWDG